jgi:protein-L-isoaspartate(D-aspartate) O-methyltransferase
MFNYEVARANMVESQVRPNGVTDPRILEAMATIPREDFVPEGQRDLAYFDGDVPVSEGPGPHRYLMEPMVFARLTQLADIGAADRVLDIGCATGYGIAVIARLAGAVIGIDEDATLVTQAAAALKKMGANNATVHTGRHADGDPVNAPYDVIIIEGCIPVVTQSLLGQLAPGGRLVAVECTHSMSRAMLYQRNGNVTRVAAFDASVQQLPGIVAPSPGFVF